MKKLLYVAVTASIGVVAFCAGHTTARPEVITETVTEIVQADPKVICMDVPVPVEVPVEVPTEKLVYVPQIQTETEYIEVPKSTLDLNDPNDINMVCDIFGKIVDWNTDGQELAVMTADGYEFYAYKSADVYQNKNYVPVNGQ